MDLEFRHLRIVCAIADAGSVTRASTKLSLSQPALTHQLQRIETLLGGRLFVRDRQGAHPTALGEFVLSRGRALLSAVDGLGSEGQREPPVRRVAPTLVRFSTVGSPMSTAVLEALQARLPDAAVTMRTEAKPRRMLDLLAGRRLELALLGEYPALRLPRPAGVTVSTVTEVPVFVVLSSTHPLAGRDEVDLAELSEEKWILRPEREQRCAENLRRACAHAGFEPHVAHWLEPEASFDAVHRGHGITIARPGTPDTDKVAVRPLRGSPIVFRDLLAWPEDGMVTPFGLDLVTVAVRATWQAMTRVSAHAAWLSNRQQMAGWA